MGALALAPILPTLQRRIMTRSTSVYYLSSNRDAVLGIQTSPTTWTLVDHVTQHPGSGAGKRLRQLLWPSITEALTTAGVELHIVAANDKLASLYQAECPGLVNHGPHRPRGVLLIRSPH